MIEHDGVTLGEVNRNVEGLRRDVADVSRDVVTLKVSAGTQEDRIRRLESIVYGALGTSIAGLVTAVIAVLTR